MFGQSDSSLQNSDNSKCRQTFHDWLIVCMLGQTFETCFISESFVTLRMHKTGFLIKVFDWTVGICYIFTKIDLNSKDHARASFRRRMLCTCSSGYFVQPPNPCCISTNLYSYYTCLYRLSTPSLSSSSCVITLYSYTMLANNGVWKKTNIKIKSVLFANICIVTTAIVTGIHMRYMDNIRHLERFLFLGNGLRVVQFTSVD